MTGPTYPPQREPQWQPPPPRYGNGYGYGYGPGQGWGPPPWQPPPPPPPVEPPPNIAAIISVVSGFLGLLLPIVFGPLALITGFVGEYQARRGGRRLLWVAVLGIVLGTVWTIGALVMLGR